MSDEKRLCGQYYYECCLNLFTKYSIDLQKLLFLCPRREQGINMKPRSHWGEEQCTRTITLGIILLELLLFVDFHTWILTGKFPTIMLFVLDCNILYVGWQSAFGGIGHILWQSSCCKLTRENMSQSDIFSPFDIIRRHENVGII